MQRPQPKKPDPKTTISLRVSPALLEEFHEFVLDYNTAHNKPGFGYGLPEVVTESLALRWALQAGLPVLREQLEDYQKKQKGGKR